MRRLLREPRLVGVLGRPMADAQWDLRGRCVVVTGASSGMGAETARFLGARGARLTRDLAGVTDGRRGL